MIYLMKIIGPILKNGKEFDSNGPIVMIKYKIDKN